MTPIHLRRLPSPFTNASPFAVRRSLLRQRLPHAEGNSFLLPHSLSRSISQPRRHSVELRSFPPPSLPASSGCTAETATATMIRRCGRGSSNGCRAAARCVQHRRHLRSLSLSLQLRQVRPFSTSNEAEAGWLKRRVLQLCCSPFSWLGAAGHGLGCAGVAAFHPSYFGNFLSSSKRGEGVVGWKRSPALWLTALGWGGRLKGHCHFRQGKLIPSGRGRT
ncbi:hypothetical protein SASPL_145318 [Salvia splendens]|uniref:Uncharacterized protein n=1 Tax=Salvia splendens TaxID=180675 RepID=A0A8X8WI96_SALSN|nr:hypothetical protein SASPL_145318 [Salvia splendens]